MSTRNEGPLASIDEMLDAFDSYAVARKEFQDTIRSRWFLVLSLFFVLVFSLIPIAQLYLQIGRGISGGGTTDDLIFLLKDAISLLVPLIAVVVGHGAITGERDTGTLKILLSLPNTRRDVVLGKIIGRSLVVALPIFIGFAVAALLVLPTDMSIELGNYVGFSLLTAFLGVIFVSLSVGISAAMPRNFYSMIGSVAAFFYFGFLWNLGANGIGTILVEYANITSTTRMKTVLAIKLINPMQAFKTLVDSVVQSSAVDARVLMFGVFRRGAACEQALGGSISEGGCQVSALPFQYSDPVIFGYMLFWLVVPAIAGYYVFRDADL